MFDAGFTELLLIFVLGLLILGPERLPRVAAQLGRWIGRARRTASQLRRQLEREVELAELAERHPRPPRVPAHKPAATPDGTSPTESVGAAAPDPDSPAPPSPSAPPAAPDDGKTPA
jgi:sec-independent protein translocase protein TatB